MEQPYIERVLEIVKTVNARKGYHVEHVLPTPTGPETGLVTLQIRILARSREGRIYGKAQRAEA